MFGFADLNHKETVSCWLHYVKWKIDKNASARPAEGGSASYPIAVIPEDTEDKQWAFST